MQRNPKVLIVDDDASLRESLTQIFKSMDCEVKTAKDGVEALDLVLREKFTVVLTDVRMPRMDGVTLLENIERHGGLVPVVIMSGYSDYDDVQIEHRNGVVLLEKPFTRRQVKEMIEKFIRILP